MKRICLKPGLKPGKWYFLFFFSLCVCVYARAHTLVRDRETNAGSGTYTPCSYIFRDTSKRTIWNWRNVLRLIWVKYIVYILENISHEIPVTFLEKLSNQQGNKNASRMVLEWLRYSFPFPEPAFHFFRWARMEGFLSSCWFLRLKASVSYSYLLSPWEFWFCWFPVVCRSGILAKSSCSESPKTSDSTTIRPSLSRGDPSRGVKRPQIQWAGCR